VAEGRKMPKARPDGAPFTTQPPSPEEEVAKQFGAGRRGTIPFPMPGDFGSGGRK